MKKFKLLATSLTAFLSIFCSVQASENSVTPYRLVNIEQYGHSDGYREEGWGPFKTKVFVGTNIYKAWTASSFSGPKQLLPRIRPVIFPLSSTSKSAPQIP